MAAALLAGLAAFAALSAWSEGAAHAHTDGLHITEAQWQVQDAPGFSAAPPTLDSASLPAAWQTAGLPHALPISLLRQAAAAAPGITRISWFRLSTQGLPATQSPLALYGARVRTDGTVARFRLEPRLEDTGVALLWEVRELPTLHWLDPSSALHILRIVQESVANILRHTRATEIRVGTAVANGGVQVTIEDNGQGFDVEAALAEAHGKGLHNQQRRAQMLDGTVAWASGPGGTRFTLWLPLELASRTA